MTDPEKLRIAIIGAGIAGLATTIALQKHKGIDVQLYERASELREIGASIALGPNGMKTLERLGVREALSDELAFRNESGFPMVYRHWKTNEVISVDEHHGDIAYRHRTSRFYRAHLQQALAAHVDPERIHLNRKFVALAEVQGTGEVLISFANGSTTSADIVLGADGIHSAVRQSFVPKSQPKWTGWVAFRSIFSADLVSHIPGVLDGACFWWSQNRTFFSSKLGKNLFTIVGGNYSDPDAPDALYKKSTWNSEGDLKVLKDFYQDWHPTIRQMIDASPYTRMYPNTFAPALDTWLHGNCSNVTYAGDAAHAHGGAFAAGGSLALDDAWAFSRAVFHVYPPTSTEKPSRKEITTALKIYEKTRKPHADRVLATVYANNRKAVERLGRDESDEELKTRMRNRMDPFWIHEHDVEASFERVVEEMEGSGVQARL